MRYGIFRKTDLKHYDVIVAPVLSDDEKLINWLTTDMEPYSRKIDDKIEFHKGYDSNLFSTSISLIEVEDNPSLILTITDPKPGMNNHGLLLKSLEFMRDCNILGDGIRVCILYHDIDLLDMQVLRNYSNTKFTMLNVNRFTKHSLEIITPQFNVIGCLSGPGKPTLMSVACGDIEQQYSSKLKDTHNKLIMNHIIRDCSESINSYTAIPEQCIDTAFLARNGGTVTLHGVSQKVAAAVVDTENHLGMVDLFIEDLVAMLPTPKPQKAPNIKMNLRKSKYDLK